MTTNDHTVPQMYLRRFAELRSGKGFYTTAAAPVDDLSNSFRPGVNKVAAVKGFYWASNPDGTDHHELEALFQKIETAAVPAFAAALDDKEGALPRKWPLPINLRIALAWWLAAQILRTTRQRARIARLTAAQGELQVPTDIGRHATNHPHVAYIVQQLAGLARVIYDKPWCIGFSDVCLITSDVPVVILNGQDDEDQDSAAWHDVIYLPLDPHRFLLMPGIQDQEEDRRKRVDHRSKMDGGLGLFFNDAIWAAADRLVFWHPDHDSTDHMIGANRGPRLPAPGTGTPRSVPQYAVMYGVLPNDMTVERRWLTEHAPPRSHETNGTSSQPH